MTAVQKKPSVHKVLAEAAVLIKKGWTQGALARSKSGRTVYSCSPKAVRWCLAGALYNAIDPDDIGNTYFIAKKHLKTVGGILEPLSIWNDAKERTQAQVLALLRKAIRTPVENGSR